MCGSGRKNQDCRPVDKGFIITISVSVALGIQHAMRMRHVFMCVVCPAPQHFFPTLSNKWHDFRGGGGGRKNSLNKKNVFFDILYNFLSQKCLITKRIQQDTITFLSDFNKTLNFLRRFFRKKNISKYKIS